MATTDHLFLDLQLSKVNFSGLMMQLGFFLKIISIFWLFLSKANVQQSYPKIYVVLTDLYLIKQKPWKMDPNITFSKILPLY